MPDSIPGSFRVEAEELGSVARKLDDCATGMKSASYSMEQASVREIGHGTLEQRCGEFRDAWDYGIGQLSKLTDAIRDGLHASANSYAGCDAKIQETFAKAAGDTGAVGNATSGSSRSVADDFG